MFEIGNPGEEVVWGLLVVLYPYLTGIVAGSFVVSTLVHVFGKKRYEPVIGIAMIISLTFLIVSPLPLLLELGRPERAAGIFLSPNLGSPMAIFGYLLLTLLILYIIESIFLFRPGFIEKSKNSKMKGLYRLLAFGHKDVTEEMLVKRDRTLKVMGLITIPLVFLFHGYVGFIFGSIKSHELWSTPMMSLIFITSALVSGVAMVILLYALMSKDEATIKKDALNGLAKLLSILIIVDLAFILTEMSYHAYLQTQSWPLISSIYGGPLFATFMVQLVIGAFIPLILFSRDGMRKSKGIAIFASLMVLIGILAYRWNVVVGGQLLPKIQSDLLVYTPTANDLFLAVLVFLITFFVLLILVFLLPWKAVTTERLNSLISKPEPAADAPEN
jgi:Ni/Fe-hydrogenase subunit HybB-like protein